MIKSDKYHDRESERNKRNIRLEEKKTKLTTKGDVSNPDDGSFYVKNQGGENYDLNIKMDNKWRTVPLKTTTSGIRTSEQIQTGGSTNIISSTGTTDTTEIELGLASLRDELEVEKNKLSNTNSDIVVIESDIDDLDVRVIDNTSIITTHTGDITSINDNKEDKIEVIINSNGNNIPPMNNVIQEKYPGRTIAVKNSSTGVITEYYYNTSSSSWLPKVSGATNLDALIDVDTTTISPSPKEFLRYNGTIWENKKYQLEGNVTNATREVGGLLTSTNISNWTVDEILKRIIIPAPAPTVTVTLNYYTIDYGQSVTVSWTSSNSTTRIASGNWTGEKEVSGSETFTNLTSNKSYTLTVSGEGGTAISTKYLTVNPYPSPVINFTLSSNTINYNESVTLTWSSTYTNTDLTASGTGWSGVRQTSGTETFTNLTSSKTYILTATGIGGSTSVTRSLTVNPAPVPTISLTANSTTLKYGTSTTLNWVSSTAFTNPLTTSSIPSGLWVGTRSTGSGSESTGVLTTSGNSAENKTYTLTATGPGGSNSASVVINVKPIPPAPLTLGAENNKILLMTNYSFYTARLSSNGELKSNLVISETQKPEAKVENFFSGESGTLSAEINGIVSGSRVLTSGVNNDIGTYNSLVIYGDDDPYGGDQFYNQGWHVQLRAKILPESNLSYGQEYNYKLTHTPAGQIPTSKSTPVKTFYIDNPPSTVIISGISHTIESYRTISGIQFATAIKVTFTSNVIGAFYRNGVVHQVSSSNTSTSTWSPTGAVSSGTYTLTVNTVAGIFTYNSPTTFVCTAYNSKNVSGENSTYAPTINIDNVSNETGRITSGTGRFPTTYGGSYNSLQSLNDNKELQLVDGRYRYPLEYYYPSIIADSHNSMRWYTQSFGNQTNVQNFLVEINGAGYFYEKIETDFEIYVKVGNSGWIVLHSAQQGNTVPYNDGDSALVYGSILTTATTKEGTFATGLITGNSYVRVGIQSGSNKYFSSLSFTKL